MNETDKEQSEGCFRNTSDWTEGGLTLLGTAVFFVGHAIAFFFHVVLPAGLAVLGISGLSMGFEISPEVDVLLQSTAFLLLLGAWFHYLRKFRTAGITACRLGLGALLSAISMFVIYRWLRTINLLMEGV